MATAIPSRPLVVISASHKDTVWRDWLKAALEIDTRIEWWDDSRIDPGHQRANEIQEALRRASVAVVLLSPEYLSRHAPELVTLLANRASEPGTLALFPIVVHPCDWQSVKELRDAQVWAMGRPLDSLPETVLQVEQKAIADGVARTVFERASAGPKPSPTYRPPSVAPSRPLRERASEAVPTPPPAAATRVSKTETPVADPSPPSVAPSRPQRERASEAVPTPPPAAANRVSETETAVADPSPPSVAPSRPLRERASEAVSTPPPAAANRASKTGAPVAHPSPSSVAPSRPLRERASEAVPTPPPAAADRFSKTGAPFADPGTPAFEFSQKAEHIITRARELAERSGRDRVTSSCLLFALTESAGGERRVNDTPRFIRQAIELTGKYAEALNAFMTDAAPTKGGERSVTLEPLGAVSANVRATLEAARSMAERTSRARTIHSRHLFAALLATPAPYHDPVARMRLQRLGVDMAVLVRDFRTFLRATVPTDNDAAWDEILGPAGEPMPESPPEPPRSSASPSAPADNRYVSGPAGYTSEFVGVGGTHPVSDALGVKGSAHRLAELIALRETKMPLAIGLFGDWGSGKSHFMNLIDRRLKTLAETAAGDDPWCKEIVPIYFNAWHYLDANLWASLITEIFDGLFRHLEPKKDVLETARAQLRDAGGAVALAEEEVTRARTAVATANTTLQDARQESTAAREAARGLLNNLSALVSPGRLEQTRVQLEEWLGVQAEVATLAQLTQKHRALASWPGRVRELWRRTTAQPGRWWRLGWLAGLLVITPAIVWIAGDSAPVLKRLLGSASPYAKLVLGWAIGVITWLTPGLTRIQRHLGEMERLQQEAEDAAARVRNNDPRVVAAERRVRDAEAAAAAAEAGLAQAKALEQRLTQAVDDLLPERRLTRFIEARARSADYRGQLGLVSLARRDFQELSDIFTDREALDAKKKMLSAEEAAALEKLGASIDRIVLFVDDLDRCQADKVVDVLQAVHLLLAYPLFAVVVGVDQRSLRQSLRTQFSGLLSGERPANGAGEDDERPATPLDYLEKIFHVPFRLPPMNKDGFADLVTALTMPHAAATAGDAASSPSIPVANTGVPAPQMALTPVGSPPTGTPAATASTGGALAETPGNRSGAPQASPPPPKTIGSVPLQDWERTAIKDYHSLVRTPRGATRFLNTYRLLRAGLIESDWSEFRGDGMAHGEFRIAMLLLASAAGHPAVASEWFHLLREKAPQEVRPADVEADAKGWEQFKTVYESTVGRVTPTPSRATVVKWIERVEQFTF